MDFVFRIAIALCLSNLIKETFMPSEKYEVGRDVCEGCSLEFKVYKLFPLAGRLLCTECKMFWLEVLEAEGQLPMILG
jgi:hypothetical protein